MPIPSVFMMFSGLFGGGAVAPVFSEAMTLYAPQRATDVVADDREGRNVSVPQRSGQDVKAK